MVRMRWSNKNLLFPEYRNRGAFYLCYKLIRYCMFFQVLFYSVMGHYFFLGSLDHLMSKSSIVSATNKDSIHIGRCTALRDVVRFNSGSWAVAMYIILLSYATWVEIVDWDYMMIPDPLNNDQHLNAILFAGPATFMAVMAFVIPLILNPYVLGWPFNPPFCGFGGKKPEKKKATMPKRSTRDLQSSPGGKVVDLHTFMEGGDVASKLEKEADRVKGRQDVELGSLATNDFGSGRNDYPISVANPEQSPRIASRRNMRSGNGSQSLGANARVRADLATTGSAQPRNSSGQQNLGANGRVRSDLGPAGSDQPRTSSGQQNQNRVKLAMI